jgi:superfamily II DNA/RNA helicase
VSSALTTRGFAAGAVHGDLGQGQRERAMRAFRTGKVDVLVATDVAARGLDVDDVTHVINYECPEDEKAYLHRIGRTGRAGREGVAVTFVDWADLARWKMINDTLNLGHPEPLETYSTSDHLFAELNIPAGTNGVLPRAKRARAGLEAEVLEDIGETGKTRSRGGSSGADHGRPRGGGRHTDRGDSSGQEPGPRRARVRRRTRSGVQVGEGAVPAGSAPEAAGVSAGAAGSAGAAASAGAAGSAGPAGSAGSAGSAGEGQRRRRRRRSPRPAGASPASAADSASSDSNS